MESINPEAYTIVELVSGANVQHCRRANADEVIVISEFSSKLISRAALDHGISTVLSELLSSRSGDELQKLSLPESLAGAAFLDVMTVMKRDRRCTVLGVQKGGEGIVVSNPPAEYRVEAGDFLIVIAPGPSG